MLDTEAHLVLVAGANVAHGVVLSQTDLARVTQAVRRIAWLRKESMGVSHA